MAIFWNVIPPTPLSLYIYLFYLFFIIKIVSEVLTSTTELACGCSFLNFCIKFFFFFSFLFGDQLKGLFHICLHRRELLHLHFLKPWDWKNFVCLGVIVITEPKHLAKRSPNWCNAKAHFLLIFISLRTKKIFIMNSAWHINYKAQTPFFFFLFFLL